MTTPSFHDKAERALVARLIFVNRFFYPDHSGTSQMLSDLAFALARRGYSPTIITSRQRYDDAQAQLASLEEIGGVRVVRVWTSRFGRYNLAGRVVDYLTFYLTAAWALLRVARAGDIIVAKTDPPMMSVLAWPIARLRRAQLINWLQDIFPEIAERSSPGGAISRLCYGAIAVARNVSLRRAEMNVAVGDRMAEHVRTLGVKPDRVVVIPNWADGSFVRPVAAADNELRQEWGLADDFVVGYSGNLGRAHEFETFLIAMEAVARHHVGSEGSMLAKRTHWLFIGGGALVHDLKSAVERRGLGNVSFKPYAPREDLALSLSAADVHLISLRSDLEGLVVPSKVYGIAAAGRPAIFIGDVDGEIARLLSRKGFGIAVPQGNGAELARSILQLAGGEDTCRAMGARARAAFEESFDKTLAVDRWQALLERLQS